MTQNKDTSMARDWPKASHFNRSIKLEFSVFVSVLIILMMLAAGYFITDQFVDTVTRNVAEKLLVQARSYSSPASKLILATDGPDQLLLNNLCIKMAKDNPDVLWAGIVGNDSIFMAHTQIQKVISSSRFDPVSRQSFHEILNAKEGFDIRSDTIYISVPIEEKGIKLGKMVVSATTKSINAARKKSITAIASVTLIAMLVGIPVIAVSLNKKLSPISMIVKSLKGINFDDISLKIPVRLKNEFGYLAETLNVMGLKLNQAQKHLVEKERIAREFEIAHEIQTKILPKKYPRARAFKFAGTYHSAKEVGGDYYDFFEFDENRMGFLVADVSGKSLPGMLVMLMTRDIVLRLWQKYDSPRDLLIALNQELSESITQGMFVTMFLGILDINNSNFIYSSAGHNPLIHYSIREGKCNLVKTKGFPLGMVPTKQFESRLESGSFRLYSGDLIVQYTDGINEAQNINADEYGMERFVANIQEHSDLDVDKITQKVIADIDNFTKGAVQYDDITLLVMKWAGLDSKKEIHSGEELEKSNANQH